MDMTLHAEFTARWKKYFNKAELPMIFFYTDDIKDIKKAKTSSGHRCLISDLANVRKGTPLAFDEESVVCYGAKRYLGFSRTIMPNFEYFLSCGIPGEMEGERYKKSPEIVREIMENSREFTAPAKYIVFKRWDAVDDDDNPSVVVFFAVPDVLSGLFTLTGFDEVDNNRVFTPFAAGCGSIVSFPYLETESESPRAVIGMFDVSARPSVPKDTLSFAVPMKKFETMIANMDESFLITDSWRKVQRRIDR
ncbi:MAG: DUF169 domain-containing protein [Deltaproteobacteria bacterium]|nr:DUF169 domain-containing protein [Candidatus Zymogenaceae bacterium]